MSEDLAIIIGLILMMIVGAFFMILAIAFIYMEHLENRQRKPKKQHWRDEFR